MEILQEKDGRYCGQNYFIIACVTLYKGATQDSLQTRSETENAVKKKLVFTKTFALNCTQVATQWHYRCTSILSQ